MGDNIPKVNWRRLPCNDFGYPKWIFILQIAILERILTMDRLLQWGAIDSARCPLCDQANESHNHLFFERSYSGKVWSNVGTWQEEKHWATTYATGQNIRSEVYQMCLAGAVYHIWIERNARVFTQGQKEKGIMVRHIIQEIHVRGFVKSKIAKKLDTVNFYP
ncbi:hypothetical protein R3W88_033797 [Solanum pinnatisectum]|uniref:Reverse transcriptase zinc-binding domain-containing protein n=1 Tax=Solanum pinnatisectum TaxID=50273 RepID=A0AAV9K024_9SOLN|nr:hypothetical protein R3W88_033797 [Solanum pinnatisectum]